MLMKYTLCVATVLLFVVSCTKKKEPQPPPKAGGCGNYRPYTKVDIPSDSACTAFVIDSFPLAVGNRWTYLSRNLGYNACGKLYYDSFVYTMSVVSDTVVNGFRVAVVSNDYQSKARIRSYDEETSFASTYFYDNAVVYLLNFNGALKQLDKLSDADSSYLLSDTATIIKFPPQNSVTWPSHEYVLQNSIQVQRNWEGYTYARLPIGVVKTRKLNINDTAHSARNSQFYSEKGLVQIVQTAYGPSTGSMTGPINKVRVTTLIDVNLL